MKLDYTTGLGHPFPMPQSNSSDVEMTPYNELSIASEFDSDVTEMSRDSGSFKSYLQYPSSTVLSRGRGGIRGRGRGGRRGRGSGRGRGSSRGRGGGRGRGAGQPYVSILGPGHGDGGAAAQAGRGRGRGRGGTARQPPAPSTSTIMTRSRTRNAGN